MNEIWLYFATKEIVPNLVDIPFLLRTEKPLTCSINSLDTINDRSKSIVRKISKSFITFYKCKLSMLL